MRQMRRNADAVDVDPEDVPLGQHLGDDASGDVIGRGQELAVGLLIDLVGFEVHGVASHPAARSIARTLSILPSARSNSSSASSKRAPT